jgi:hypothetical protein
MGWAGDRSTDTAPAPHLCVQDGCSKKEKRDAPPEQMRQHIYQANQHTHTHTNVNSLGGSDLISDDPMLIVVAIVVMQVLAFDSSSSGTSTSTSTSTTTRQHLSLRGSFVDLRLCTETSFQGELDCLSPRSLRVSLT